MNIDAESHARTKQYSGASNFPIVVEIISVYNFNSIQQYSQPHTENFYIKWLVLLLNVFKTSQLRLLAIASF